MITMEEWEECIQAVAEQLQGLSVIDAVAVLNTMLVRLISTAPPELQHILSMKVAALMIDAQSEEESKELH
jgi:hypothetical protein